MTLATRGDPALAEMLALRYGGAHLAEIAARYGLTGERIRQILVQADPNHTARAAEARRRQGLAVRGRLRRSDDATNQR